MEDGEWLRGQIAKLGHNQSSFARLLKVLGDDRDLKNILRSIQRMIAGDARVSGEMRALIGALHKASSNQPLPAPDLADVEAIGQDGAI